MGIKKNSLALIPYSLLAFLCFCNMVLATGDWNISGDWTVSEDWGESPPPTYPPVAIFTKNASTIYINETVAFNGSASYDFDGYITDWDWDFGDGNTSTTETANNTFRESGVFTVTLTVTDNSLATDDTSQTLTVLDVEGSPTGYEMGFSSFTVDSKIGFMCGVNETLLLTITDGEITSQNITANIQQTRGHFIFLATSNATLQANINDLRVSASGDQGNKERNLFDGDTLIIQEGNNVKFYWNTGATEMLLPIMFIFGMVGLMSMFGGILYPIHIIKSEHDYRRAFITFTIFFFVGFALFISWVFG